MKIFLPIAIGTLTIFSGFFTGVSKAENAPYSVPPVDAPQLAALGSYPIGVRTLHFTNPQQADLAKMVATGGKEAASDRQLKVDVWYPALAAPANTATVLYKAVLPRGGNSKGSEFEVPGIAVRDAKPKSAQRFPLVLISHGFGGWSTFLSYLGENLASKGYVVAAIDHADADFIDMASFRLSFGSVLVHRAQDQQFILRQLGALAEMPDEALGEIIDDKNIAVIGYSMGGFGALATAGAGYDAASPTFQQLPKSLIAPMTYGNADFDNRSPLNIKALVLMAPWGGQVANRAWSAAAMKTIKTPTLFVVGDQDDIVDFKNGVSWIYQAMQGADRHMLVYQNALHNVSGNPAPVEAQNDFIAREYFDEPVWRKDRLMAINSHFITAFLDQHLKNDVSKSKYLDVPTSYSNEATWPVPFGQRTTGEYANGTGASAQYWLGFQRRSAIGLEMLHKKVGE